MESAFQNCVETTGLGLEDSYIVQIFNRIYLIEPV